MKSFCTYKQEIKFSLEKIWEKIFKIDKILGNEMER